MTRSTLRHVAHATGVVAVGLVAAAVLAVSLGMPATDTSELLAISFGAAAAIGLAGWAVLRRLHRSPLALQGMVVVAVAVGAVLGGTLAAARAMFVSAHDLKAVSVVMVAAATVAAVAALHLARRVGDASRRLGAVTRMIGRDDDWIAAAESLSPVPGELARLGAELDEMRTRLADASARTQRSEQSRREVIAWVSHDLRTPIARMRAMAEALNDGILDGQATIDRYHVTLLCEIERLGGLVDDLFELSRIQADAVRLTPEPVVLADLVSDTIASAGVSAEDVGVRLTGDALDRRAIAALSIPEMARVLHNLLDNAIRHSPPGGEVRVAVEASDDDVSVSVSDQCGGIPQHDLERVFDLAYRGDAARSDAPLRGGVSSGAGLGLAIAKGFVEAHHGRIAVHNEGVGCTFTVRMPRWEPNASTVA